MTIPLSLEVKSSQKLWPRKLYTKTVKNNGFKNWVPNPPRESLGKMLHINWVNLLQILWRDLSFMIEQNIYYPVNITMQIPVKAVLFFFFELQLLSSTFLEEKVSFRVPCRMEFITVFFSGNTRKVMFL